MIVEMKAVLIGAVAGLVRYLLMQLRQGAKPSPRMALTLTLASAFVSYLAWQSLPMHGDGWYIQYREAMVGLAGFMALPILLWFDALWAKYSDKLADHWAAKWLPGDVTKGDPPDTGGTPDA